MVGLYSKTRSVKTCYNSKSKRASVESTSQGYQGSLRSGFTSNALELRRLVWPLMVYEITVSCMKRLEHSISKKMKRWLGLPPSFTTIGPYRKTTKLQLPLTSLFEEYKVSKARLLLTLRDSTDEKISKNRHQLSNWEEVVSYSSSRPVGTINSWREGLVVRQQQRWGTAATRYRMILEEQRKISGYKGRYS